MVSELVNAFPLIPVISSSLPIALPAPIEEGKYLSFESWRNENPYEADKWFIWFFLYHNKRRKRPLSENSLKAYLIDITQMLEYFYSLRCAFRDVGYLELDSFEQETKKSFSQNSAKRKLTLLSALLRFGAKNQFFERDMSDYINIPEKKNTKAERKLTPDQVEKLLEEFKKKTILYGVFLTFYYTGVRVSEFVKIRLCDFRLNVKGTYYLNVIGKGGKLRKIPLNPQFVLFIIQFLNGQGRYSGFMSSDEFLFLSRNNRPLSDRGVREMVTRAARRAGLHVKLSPHWFRHTFATFALLGGAPIDQVQRDMGHSDLRTTQDYLHDLESEIREGAGNYVGRVINL